MPSVVVADGQLEIQLGPIEAFKAGMSSFRVENWRVQSVLVDSGERRSKLGSQTLGRSAFTGVFMIRRDRSFVYWPKATEAVVITVLHPHWHQIVLGVNDAAGLVGRLKEEFGNL